MFPKIVVPPESSIFNRGFHYKPSILGYPYFWKHPYLDTKPATFFSLRKSFNPKTSPTSWDPEATDLI